MRKRYQIMTGRNSDGSTNYGVQDSMPNMGFDGRVCDYSSRVDAEAHIAMANQAFEEQSTLMMRDHGMV